MKSFKLLAVAFFAAASFVSSYAADLGTVYVTGSTAYRAATNNAIKALFTTGSVQYGHTGASFTGSSQIIAKGTLASTGDTVTIVTSFNGSAAGIQAIVQTTTDGINGNPANVPLLKYINPGQALAANPGVSTGLSAGFDHASDIAMSDVRVELTPFTRDSDLAAFEAGSSPVGVIPFYWVKNKGASAAITNLTHQVVKGLGAGGLPLSFFSKNAADTALVRIVGRNPDSGTRLTAYEESGFGARTTAVQYLPSGANSNPQTAGSGDITSFAPWPAETVLGINFGQGQSGYSSGGTLAAVMQRTSSAGAIITYLGLTDAVAAVNGGADATILSYNGVTPETSGSFASFVNGQYSFWSYERVYYNENASDAAFQIADELATKIKNVTATDSGITIGAMNVKRSAEGRVVIPK